MEENLYAERSIRTVSGKYVNVFEPTPDMIDINDIAHALSFQCRFGGHLPRFYSVAQHSWLVQSYCSEENKFAALMHDASEAYLLDIPKPIKGGLSNYTEIEDRLMKAIAAKFMFAYPLAPEIKHFDHAALVLEWEELMLRKKKKFTPDNVPLFTPAMARKVFLGTFEKLFPAQKKRIFHHFADGCIVDVTDRIKFTDEQGQQATGETRQNLINGLSEFAGSFPPGSVTVGCSNIVPEAIQVPECGANFMQEIPNLRLVATSEAASKKMAELLTRIPCPSTADWQEINSMITTGEIRCKNPETDEELKNVVISIPGLAQ